MPGLELLKDTERQLVICNACRYCEGYCAVFPAMERRRNFSPGDLTYLANLCFDCRACYYACQYAPPHEFNVNVPKVFAQIRTETYQEYGWPRLLAGLYRRGLAGALVPSALCAILVLLAVVVFRGPGVLLTADAREGAFYRVIPYEAMVVPALAPVALRARRVRRRHGAVLAGHRGARRRHARPARLRPRRARRVQPALHERRRRRLQLPDRGVLLRATAASITWSSTGSSSTSPRRAWRRCTTTSSTGTPRIRYLSWPVVLGTAGGVMMVIGTAGLLYLKRKSDAAPAEPTMVSMDLGFLMALFLTSLTGLLLLFLRETAAMGTLLAIHLGVVAALFITLPYGKFAHLFYRYAALIRNALEERAADQAPAHQ